MHVAFEADSRAEVDAFHAAALAAGATDNGAPGIRAHYHPDYYGAFVLDPTVTTSRPSAIDRDDADGRRTRRRPYFFSSISVPCLVTSALAFSASTGEHPGQFDHQRHLARPTSIVPFISWRSAATWKSR